VTTPVDDYKLFPKGLQKALAASGIAFAVLVIASIVVQGEDYPDFGEAAAQWRSYATENKDEVQLGALFGLLAVLEFLAFAGVVRSALARAETLLRGFTRVADVAFAGAILGAAGVALALATSAVAASQPADTPGEIVRALFHASDALWAAAVVGFAVFLLNAGVVIARSGVLPRWLGWTGMLSSLFWTLTLFSILDWENPENFFAVMWLPANLLLLVFAIGASIALVRRVGTAWPWPGLEDRTTAPQEPSAT